MVGRLAAISTTRLTQQPAETRIDYEIAATSTGKLGSLGQPVLRSKAKEMEKPFAGQPRGAFGPAGSERGS